MKPIRAKESAQLVAVIAVAAIASVLIDTLPYWREPLKLGLVLLAFLAVVKIGR